MLPREAREGAKSFPCGREQAVPASKAEPIELSAEHEATLRELVRAHSTPQKLAERARIVLLASDGLGVGEIAERLGIWRKTVGQHCFGSSLVSVGAVYVLPFRYEVRILLIFLKKCP